MSPTSGKREVALSRLVQEGRGVTALHTALDVGSCHDAIESVNSRGSASGSVLNLRVGTAKGGAAGLLVPGVSSGAGDLLVDLVHLEAQRPACRSRHTVVSARDNYLLSRHDLVACPRHHLSVKLLAELQVCDVPGALAVEEDLGHARAGVGDAADAVVLHSHKRAGPLRLACLAVGHFEREGSKLSKVVPLLCAVMALEQLGRALEGEVAVGNDVGDVALLCLLPVRTAHATAVHLAQPVPTAQRRHTPAVVLTHVVVSLRVEGRGCGNQACPLHSCAQQCGGKHLRGLHCVVFGVDWTAMCLGVGSEGERGMTKKYPQSERCRTKPELRPGSPFGGADSI